MVGLHIDLHLILFVQFPDNQNKHIFGATFNREFEGIRLDEQSDQKNLRQLANHLPELAKSIGSEDKLEPINKICAKFLKMKKSEKNVIGKGK